MKPLLSIVIPVYNVEDYIEKCIHSIFNQSVSKNFFEVIIINDGTKDNSLKICVRLQKLYPEIILITQENKGLSGARNTGLKKAIGDYIWFVDSDDWIEQNCIDFILKFITNTKLPDIIWLGHNVITNERISKCYIPKESKEISGEELYINHLDNLYYIWKFIYKRNFLLEHKLEFFEGILYEDQEFTPRVLSVAKNCTTIPIIAYNYLIRTKSISNKITNRNINDKIFILEQLDKLRSKVFISKRFKNKIEENMIYLFINTVEMSSRFQITLPLNSKSILNKLKSSKSNSELQKIKLNLMKLNLSIYLKLYKLVHNLYQSQILRLK